MSTVGWQSKITKARKIQRKSMNTKSIGMQALNNIKIEPGCMAGTKFLLTYYTGSKQGKSCGKRRWKAVVKKNLMGSYSNPRAATGPPSENAGSGSEPCRLLLAFALL